MSVEESEVIDVIGVDKSSQEVVLTISDHLAWTEAAEEKHLLVLQEKINAFLRFIESGEIIESYPDAAGRRCVINIALQHAPSAGGEEFLKQVRAILEGAGVVLRTEVLAADTQRLN